MRGRPKLYFDVREPTNLVFPKSVKEDAIKEAASRRLSLSQWVVELIEESLKKKKS